MATLETLSIQFRANGTDKAIKNIKAMGEAVKALGDGLKVLETTKLNSFADAMGVIKKNTPTDTQAKNMERFATAVLALSTAINGADFTGFSAGLTATAQAANSMKKGAVNNVKAMADIGKEAEKAADKINKATSKSSQSTSETDTSSQKSSVDTIVASLRKVESSTAKVKQMFKGIIVPTKQFKSLEEQADKIAGKYEKLRTKIQNALNEGKYKVGSSKYKEKMAELEGLQNEYDRLIQKQKDLALSGDGLKLNPNVQGALSAFKDGFTKVAAVAKNQVLAAFHKMNSVLGSLVKKMFSLVTASKAFKATGTNVKDLAKKLSSELLRLTKMLKLMVTRMALRKIIEEVGNGFKSLALHSKEFDDAMSNVINGSKQLGYSFAAMISPLINALAPALVYIIDLLTRLVNVLNQVFSALSGASTWNKAIKFTDKWSDSIKEAGKSGSKAAKELKKTVLGFDELNQLQDNKNSGGGGSDIKDMFETVDIDPKWKKFADWLKDMWKMGDFTELGKLWGTKLRDALESIPWDQIRATANKLGGALATLINGFVEVERLGYDIGKTIAQSVNTVFEFINGFVHKLHWKSIGKFIGETFNGFFENIDWPLIKDTVVTGFKGLAEAIQEFIETFHWDNISNFVINGLDTVVAGIREFFEGIKWGDLGAKIGDQIAKIIKGTPWKEVGLAIGDMIQAAIDFASNLINQLDVQDAIDALTELWKGITEQVDFEQAGETLGKALQYVKDLIKGFWDENGDEVKEKFHEFFSGLWNTLDDDLPELLGIAFDIGWQIIKEIIRGLWDNKAGVMAILGLALVWGLKAAASFAIGKLVTLGIGKAIGKQVATQISTELAAQLATKGATEAVEAGTTLGDSVGAGVTASATKGGLAQALAGLQAAILPVAATVALGYAIAIPASKELEKILTENQTKVDDLKGSMDNSIPTFDEMSQAAREASRNQKEYAEKMQDMYDTLLKTHPELDNLKTALEENGIKIGNNVERLLQINEGLNIFNSNGGSAADTLSTLEEKYGKVDRKTQDFFNSLGQCEDKYAGVIDKVNEYNAKIEESDSATGNLIKTYKSEKDYLEDRQKAVDNVVGSFKTHWDVVNQNKDATEKLTDKYKTHADVIKDLQKKNEDTSKSYSDAVEEVKSLIQYTEGYQKSTEDLEKVLSTNKDALDELRRAVDLVTDANKGMVEYSPEAEKALQDLQEIMKETGGVAAETGDNIVEGIKEPLSNAEFDSESKSLFDSLFGSLEDVFGIASPAKNMKPIGDNIILGVNEGMTEGFDSFDTTFTDFYENHVKTWFDKDKWSFEGVGEGLKKTFEGAKSAIKEVWNGIADKLNGEHEIGSSKMKINLPKFAGGGFPEDGLFMANRSELVGTFSNGKTAVANNEQIISGIERGVYSAVSAAMANNSGGSSYISNEIMVDGEVIARSITKAQEKMNRRYSPQTS